MGHLVLAAHAEDDGIFLFELTQVALKIVRFLGATAGELLGIKIENDPFAAEIVEAERFAILGVQGEVWRGSAGGRRFLTGAHGAGDGESYR